MWIDYWYLYKLSVNHVVGCKCKEEEECENMTVGFDNIKNGDIKNGSIFS